MKLSGKRLRRLRMAAAVEDWLRDNGIGGYPEGDAARCLLHPERCGHPRPKLHPEGAQAIDSSHCWRFS